MAEPYFKKVLKGYDPGQVDAFIIELSDRYSEKEREFTEQANIARNETERLNAEISLLRAEADAAAKEYSLRLAEKQKEYDDLCAEIGERMVLADRRAIDIVRSAEREAAAIKESAQAEAENEVRRIKQDAAREAEKLIAETEKRCAELTKAAEEFRRRQDELHQSVYETERRFGDALNRLRDGIGSDLE